MDNEPTTISAANAKTVCLVAWRQPDPSVIGAMADRDTETCIKNEPPRRQEDRHGG
jgi:hypothetical protein